jgi:hypothetical protein
MGNSLDLVVTVPQMTFGMSPSRLTTELDAETAKMDHGREAEFCRRLFRS